jgi:hypothetical protein
MERNHRNYDEGEVLRDLATAGVKVNILNSQDSLEVGKYFSVEALLIVGKKVINITSKAKLGIKRLGKIDFLMNFCKGYVGVVHSK